MIKFKCCFELFQHRFKRNAFTKKIKILLRPRQIAMFLAKKMTTRSLPEIGRRFANRDHTTVIHAVKTITRLSEQDDEMKKYQSD